LGLAVAFTAVVASIAACGSSSSSSSSSSAAGSTSASNAGSSSGGLKKGLKVFVIPKNLGNNYFTVADSVKTGGAPAALQALVLIPNAASFAQRLRALTRRRRA
jgi:ABC-type sugar transport system substrate-binding protein